jgi:single-strand DNA-binding protein
VSESSNSLNIVILRGHLSRAVERRELPSGDTVLGLEVTTRGADGTAYTVPVAWPDAPSEADDLPPGEEVVVTGVVRRRFFRAGGSTQSRTEVLADCVVPASDRRRSRRAIERTVAALAS